jgi:uncharacterized protein (TIGR02145 family)
MMPKKFNVLFILILILTLTGCTTKLTVKDTIVNASEALKSDGSVTLSISGGKKPYTIKWLDGYTESKRTDLSAGRYIITIIDAKEDKIVTEVVVDEPHTGSITTSEGNEYAIIKIGQQWWFAQNFYDKTDKNGNPLESSLYEDHDEQNGLLYTHESAVKGAPQGWHLATDMDFMRLEYLYGMTEHDAEEDDTHERGSYQGLVLHPGGESGFNGEFYGWYNSTKSTFEGYGDFVKYWSDGSPEEDESLIYSRMLTKGRDDIGKFAESKANQLYVRYVYGSPAKSID